MFSTLEGSEIATPLGLRNPDEHHWSYVELLLHIPWLFVTVVKRNRRSSLRRQLFLLYPEQLAGLASGRSINIESAVLATPPHMNGSDQWRFENLSEVWRCLEPETPDQSAYLYVVATGKEYSSSLLEANPQKLIRERQIYSAAL
ncbi:MAG: hypothetical protein KIT42_16060 [Rhodocyclaceae bacterium]|nr:hypothetical protein [Rhodocyclaceae bacterium]